MQIDGINFIDHLSFDALNEGKCFQSLIRLAQELTHTKLSIMGADATNANRKLATSHNIRTDFCRKGRAGKHENQRKLIAAMITKERASRLKGSFGKEKRTLSFEKNKSTEKRNRDTLDFLWHSHGKCL